MSVFILSLLPSFAEPLLYLAAGNLYKTDGLSAFRMYAIYIPLMAINGITEAFVASFATTADLVRQSRLFIISSIVYYIAGYILLSRLELGTAGLVGATCVNLLIRCIWSLRFMQTWNRQHMHTNLNIYKCMPQRGFLLSAIVLSAVSFRVVAGHVVLLHQIAYGVVCAACLVAVWYETSHCAC
jgi:oligosaccharide translocation protein RFT1